MVADELDYVIGVDPHRDVHALAIVQVVSGAVVFEASVAASSEGYAQLVSFADMHAPGRRAFAVEGTGSFGAGLARFLAGGGERVLEVGRLVRRTRSTNGSGNGGGARLSATLKDVNGNTKVIQRAVQIPRQG